MRILCLILASDTAQEHVRFQTCWKKMMRIHPNVDCFFYKGHPDLAQSQFLEDDTLWIKIHETFETVYEKTLKAFEFFLPRLGQYDFVYRCNLSTFVSFSHMIDFCNDLPRTNCCAAVTGGVPCEDPNRNSLRHKNSFPGGNGFILSTDLVRRIVDEKPTNIGQDDLTIGEALRSWSIVITEFSRPDFINEGYWFMNNPQFLNSTEQNINLRKILFTYRLKSNDRNRDVEMFKRLMKRVYHV